MTNTPSLVPIAAAIAVLALLTAAGCLAVQSPARPDLSEHELTVYAAASLTGALAEIAHDYETARPRTKVSLNFDSSQALRAQIEQGARADLFLSANNRHITALQEEGLIVNDSVRVIAKNRLAILVPNDNRANITGLWDLARPGIRLVMGTKDAPFGDYTRQVLGKVAADPAYGPAYRDAVMANVVSEDPAVTALAAHLRTGEADAGIAYASDVSGGDREYLTTIAIPDRYNVVASYPLGIVTGSREQGQAEGFARFITSPEGQAILARYGFTPADG